MKVQKSPFPFLFFHRILRSGRATAKAETSKPRRRRGGKNGGFFLLVKTQQKGPV
jgi:hypothetical protein